MAYSFNNIGHIIGKGPDASSTTIVFDKQTRILNGFSRIVRNAERSSVPTFAERELAASAKAKRPAAPLSRISHYVPNNPLNGFHGKTRAAQVAALERIKAERNASA